MVISPDNKTQIDVAIALIAEHGKDVRDSIRLRWNVTVVMMTIMAAVLYIVLKGETALSTFETIVGDLLIVAVFLVHLAWQLWFNGPIARAIRQCNYLDNAVQNLLDGSALAGYESVRRYDRHLSLASVIAMVLVSAVVAGALIYYLHNVGSAQVP